MADEIPAALNARHPPAGSGPSTILAGHSSGAYGALWLSTRGQHPYLHPTAAVIPVGIGVGIINVIATFTVAKRATAGITGRSQLPPGQIGFMLAIWIGVTARMAPRAAASSSPPTSSAR